MRPKRLRRKRKGLSVGWKSENSDAVIVLLSAWNKKSRIKPAKIRVWVVQRKILFVKILF
jgi:hypothetical protein